MRKIKSSVANKHVQLEIWVYASWGSTI